MPQTRTTARSSSPVEASSSTLSYPPFAFAGELAPTRPLSYAFPDYDLSPQPASKKKRSHGKARPEGYVKRPPNAFIIFRTEYIKTMAAHSTPEVSIHLGDTWKAMSAAEKKPYVDKAEEAKRRHKLIHPDYKYKPVHPRDSEGRCIRKPRKPNQPRVKATPTDAPDHLSASFSWMEATKDGEFPNTAFPSDSSSASSPPRSPSPAPSLVYPQPLYQALRRSSSVPLPTNDGGFFLSADPQQNGFMYPPSPSGFHTGPVSRRLSKRPSTSMDFACPGPMPGSELYTPQADFSSWRPNHRRSISVPMYGGEIPVAQFVQAPSHSQAPIDLTPINPVFGNVFDKFSWGATSEPQFNPIVPPQNPFTGLDIPSMTHSPMSNGSATPPAVTPGVSPSTPTHTPAIQHPTPVARFDFSAFEDHVGEFESSSQVVDGGYMAPVEQDGNGNALGLVSQAYHPPEQTYGQQAMQSQTSEQYYPIDPQQGHSGAMQYAENSVGGPQEVSYPATTDMSGYREAIRYTDADQPLHFNELIVEGY